MVRILSRNPQKRLNAPRLGREICDQVTLKFMSCCGCRLFGAKVGAGPMSGNFVSAIRFATVSMVFVVLHIGMAGIPSAFGSQSQSEFGSLIQSRAEWLKDHELQRKLNQRISLTWTSSPFRDALLHFATQQNVAIFLDRRVDPTQVVDLKVDNQTVLEVLYRITDATDCGVCRMGNVFYIGPRAKVAALIVHRDRIIAATKKRPTEVRRHLFESQKIGWPHLALPEEIWTPLSKNSLVASTLELPHDLWPAYNLPHMAWLDRVILVTFGFDLSVEVSEGNRPLTISFADFQPPPPRDVQIKGGELSRSDVKILKDRFPTVRFDRNGRRWFARQVTPLQAYEINRAIAKHRSDRVAPVSPNGIKTVSVPKAKTSIGSLLASLAKQLEVEFQYAPELHQALTKQIEISANKVTYDELIRMALDGTQLDFELTDQKLIIKPKR